jgi:Phosphatidylinositol-specific phospholipase C, Y domain
MGSDSEASQGAFSLNESAAMRLLSSGPNSWIEAAQRCLLRVFPNGSRVDSSNFSPLEFWNSGVQMGQSPDSINIRLDSITIFFLKKLTLQWRSTSKHPA